MTTTTDRHLPPPVPTGRAGALPPPAPPDPGTRRSVGDPLLDERVAKLAARHTSTPPSDRTGEARRSTGRRHHAARGSRAVALALSLGTTVGLAGYLRAQASSSPELSVADGTDTAATTAATGTSTPEVSSTAATTVTSVATETGGASSSGGAGSVADSSTSSGLADGTYTGDTFTNRWGAVQVEITVSDGAISDVTVLQAPDDDRKSVSINDRAVPQLVEETLSAQSADIDTVSGATYTSDGYRQSLQSALDDARAAATS